MELAKLVLEYVKALARPIAALAIALMFRREDKGHHCEDS
jgi:hypothetical protein